MPIRHVALGFALLATLAIPTHALAHVSPPVILVSEKEALAALGEGAKSFSIHDVRLSVAQRETIRKEWGWRADEPVYRFHVGKDDGGRPVGVVAFLSESTAHGRVRVAVGLGLDGRVRDARVMEATEESLHWLKPLIDQKLLHDFAGRSSHDAFGIGERFEKDANRMRRFYAGVLASLVQRGAILFDVAHLESEGRAG